VSGIDTAIILAAGKGSRLYPREPYKPLCRVGGKPLVDRAIEGLAAAGVGHVIVVTGYGADKVEAHLGGRSWPVEVSVVRTPDWHLPNGVSARAAAPLLGGKPALLVMCDHLVDPRLYERVGSEGDRGGLSLGIDRRLGHPWVDPDDVTCVRTEGRKIVGIGKGLDPHDAYDTGVFAVGPPFFSALAELEAPSLTQAVTVLAEAGRAATVDCSDLDWIDIDDPAALAKAEQAARDGRF
jgi:choline kinase